MPEESNRIPLARENIGDVKGGREALGYGQQNAR